jgi:hypothetical protein
MEIEIASEPQYVWQNTILIRMLIVLTSVIIKRSTARLKKAVNLHYF